MPRFVPGRPVVTEEPVVEVEDLPVGRHRFRLVVVNDQGVRSRPAEVVVEVVPGIPTPVDDPIVVDRPGPFDPPFDDLFDPFDD